MTATVDYDGNIAVRNHAQNRCEEAAAGRNQGRKMFRPLLKRRLTALGGHDLI
jgi:hypothetical protein